MATRARKRRTHLKRKYNLTTAEVDTMKARQLDRCAICREEKPLVVDHDHGSGKVRSLLCTTCNLMLGHARDRKDLLLAGFSYLTHHTA
jgi:hypothetical protein